MKTLFDVLHLVSAVLLAVFAAEHSEGLGKGNAKKKYVLQTMGGVLNAAVPEPEGEGPDIEELLKIIGNLIDAVVSLLNFFGIFKHGAA